PVTRSIPPDTTSADKTLFIVVSTLEVMHVQPRRTAPSSISYGRSLSNPSRDSFKGSAWRDGSSLECWLLTCCHRLFFYCGRNQFSPMLVVRHANGREYGMSDLKRELRDYRLTTAEIVYC